jgi:hypothetical protein
MTVGTRTGLKTRHYKEPGSSPASTKSLSKAPGVADAELDGVLARLHSVRHKGSLYFGVESGHFARIHFTND